MGCGSVWGTDYRCCCATSPRGPGRPGPAWASRGAGAAPGAGRAGACVDFGGGVDAPPLPAPAELPSPAPALVLGTADGVTDVPGESGRTQPGLAIARAAGR